MHVLSVSKCCRDLLHCDRSQKETESIPIVIFTSVRIGAYTCFARQAVRCVGPQWLELLAVSGWSAFRVALSLQLAMAVRALFVRALGLAFASDSCFLILYRLKERKFRSDF